MGFVHLSNEVVPGTLLHSDVVSAHVAVIVEPSPALCSCLIPFMNLSDLVKIHALELILIFQILIIALQEVNIQVFAMCSGCLAITH